MEKKFPMTPRGFYVLQDELKHLKNVERPAIVEAIAEAREHGDLSENAEYHAARERQGYIEGRIVELEYKLSLAEVIDVSLLEGDTIKFGASVELIDEDTEEIATYQIVGSDESDIKNGYLSITSPLARALVGKKETDSIEVVVPNGSKSYIVKRIYFA